MLRDLNRILKAPYQKMTRGFTDLEVWNFDHYLARQIRRGLEWYLAHGHGYPPDITEEEWTKELETMHHFFSMYESQHEENNEDYVASRYEDIMALFAKRFRDLWD